MGQPWENLARRMVDEQLRGRGMTHPKVLAAIAQIPRHRFLPPPSEATPPGIIPGIIPGIAPGITPGSAAGSSTGHAPEWLPGNAAGNAAPFGTGHGVEAGGGDEPRNLAEAYADQPCSIGFGQTISQPFMVAVMTAQLDAQPGQKVLEVGTGSGYQTAVLVKLGARVVSVERCADLARRAQATLTELGLASGVRIVVGDGTLGWPEEAPFDWIIVTAGAPELPEAYMKQLAPGGRIVIPVGNRDEQQLLVIHYAGGQWVRKAALGCRFVPLVGKDGWRE